jgi:hypothetical protein
MIHYKVLFTWKCYHSIFLLVLVVDFIWSHGPNYQQFAFLLEIDAEYGGVLYLTQVWRSRYETVLKRF